MIIARLAGIAIVAAALGLSAHNFTTLNAAGGKEETDPDLGFSESTRKYLASRPLDGRNYLALAMNAETEGDLTRAAALVERAVRVEPRLRSGHLWLLGSATQSGDIENALDHAVTLSRLSPQAAPQISALLGALTLDPKGRQIIADRLKNEPLLLTVASEALKAGLDGDGLLDLITRSNFSSDRELMTRAQSLVASQLLREKRYEDARSAWFKIAASDPEEEIFDPKFEGLSGGAPFNWVLNTSSQVETSLQPEVANTPSALRVRAYTSLPLTAASQSLVLSPGTYELNYRASAEGGLEADPVFAWQIACTPGSLIDETIINPAGADWELADHSFTVPEACPMQNLKLVKLRTTTARAQELLVSEVTVKAAQIE